MSLIHEALERAQRDRERKAAAARGETPPPAPPPPSYRFRSPLPALITLVVVVALAAVVGWYLGRHPQGAGSNEAVAVSEATPTSAQATEDLVSRRVGTGSEEVRASGPPVIAEDAAALPPPTAKPPGLATGDVGPAASAPGADRSGNEPVADERASPDRVSSEAPDENRHPATPPPATDAAAEARPSLPEDSSSRAGPTRARAPESPQPTNPPPDLRGIAWRESNPLATIGGSLVAVGETIDGWTVVEIERRAVVLARGEERLRLELPPAG